MEGKLKSIKGITILLFVLLSAKSYSQTFSIVQNEYTTGKALSIAVKYDTGVVKFYWASCYFGELPFIPDTTKISLIESLLTKISDTSYCSKPVEAISYRYKGRYNRNPQSTQYNLQIEALVLINYIALSSDAVSYSPFPVLYDKKKGKEIKSSGKELDDVIKCYTKWFEKIKQKGLRQYPLPMISKKYEWYGTLYQKQRIFESPSKWERFYDCPKLIKEED